MSRLLPLPCAALVALGTSLVTPSQAEACGGTFCDNLPQPMPVDQRGEDILFVQDGPEVEVHVRIEYTGEAERFAWLVPLQALPEVSVGSEFLFAQLGVATAPRWTLASEYECPEEDPPSTTGGGFVPDEDFASASDPDVVLEETVGAFDVIVLQGGTAAEVIDFLAQNDYAQDPTAAPILQEYLDEGFLFAAVRLSAGAEVDEIHPLVFRFPGDEPCVPIRLTRIAAEDDMGIRAYFLGQQRWVPTNYAHVVLNPLAMPWSQLGSGGIDLENYAALLTEAVDAAGGRAFATDYAGPSDRVSSSGVYSSLWDESVFPGLNMIEALDAIVLQGLHLHPLLQPLLLEFMPPPDGVDAQDFWNNVELYGDLVDFDDWDSAGFAAAVAERIIEPGLHAADLLDAWPYLTRLHTTMSPHEMLVDPMFHPTADLGEVSNELAVERLDLCGENGDRFTIPVEDQDVPVCLGEAEFEWPALLRQYPALRIEQIPEMGPPQVIVDFGPEIFAAHASHQADQACGEGGDDEGDGDDTADAGDEGDTGGAITGGTKAGCACNTNVDGGAGFVFGLLGLAGLGLAARRRKPG